MSVKCSPERRERRSACSIRSSRSTRFGKPVSGSRRAPDAARRSLQLRTTPQAAAVNARIASVTSTWLGVSRKASVSRLEASTSAARVDAHARVPLRCRLDLIVTRDPPVLAPRGSFRSPSDSSRLSGVDHPQIEGRSSPGRGIERSGGGRRRASLRESSPKWSLREARTVFTRLQSGARRRPRSATYRSGMRPRCVLAVLAFRR